MSNQASPESAAQDAVQPIQGVFSLKKSARIGAGTTSRKVWQTTYFFAKENEEGKMEVQALSPNWTPFGPKQTVSKEKLIEDYMPEPQLYQKEVLPRLREVNKHVARADRYRKRGETFSAEFEYGKAIKVDEQNIRANFGIGLCYLERGDKEKANEVFERVVQIDGAFEKEHKHLFNDFGINLRKSEMFEQAIEYYEKALAVTENDENLHYNIARAAFEHGDRKKTILHLKQCLGVNPKHEPARRFVAYLKKLKAKEAKKAKTAPPAPQKEAAAKPKQPERSDLKFNL